MLLKFKSKHLKKQNKTKHYQKGILFQFIKQLCQSGKSVGIYSYFTLFLRRPRMLWFCCYMNASQHTALALQLVFNAIKPFMIHKWALEDLTILCFYLLIALLLYTWEEIKYLFFRELKKAPGIITKMEMLNQKTVSTKWELTCTIALNFDTKLSQFCILVEAF